jgi:anti-sigma regulatory factor (Ser/Thr protein kinase)
MIPTLLLSVRLPCEPTAPRKAREALSRLDSIESVLDDVLLVASELATNAVMHSGCTAGEEFELSAERRDGCVRIAVSDPGHGGGEPRRRTPDPSRPGGMGLAVVEQLSREWGADRSNWLQVWADLAV